MCGYRNSVILVQLANLVEMSHVNNQKVSENVIIINNYSTTLDMLYHVSRKFTIDLLCFSRKFVQEKYGHC